MKFAFLSASFSKDFFVSSLWRNVLKLYILISFNTCDTTKISKLIGLGWRAARLVLLGILIILPVSTMSSPVHGRQSRSPSPHSSGSGHHSHRSSPHRSDKPMKWVNPCRIPKSLPSQESELQMPTQTDEEIFQNIVTQAKKAEIQARQFFSAFVSTIFFILLTFILSA